MTGADKLLRDSLPTKAAQLAYHAAVEAALAAMGRPALIRRFMGRWDIKWLAVKR